tara:strand:- start:9516 stop:10313 length:798 start_codon:yes stop_codon:yes gene_type:complete
MKIGVSYNLFDGEELLEGSINSIRDNVDYISVVYQKISNFGNECSEELLPILKDLKEKKLIDELLEYKPNLKNGGSLNELTKRNLGVYLSQSNGCTHHLAMDSDEYYISDEFEYMKNIIEEEGYDSAACQMVTYYKEPIYRLDPKEEYYVSLLFKISNNKEFIIGHPFPVLVDPTRRMKSDNCKIFKREEIEMHHMSYVRNKINSKFNNSSAKVNFSSTINELISYYEKWEYPQKALMGGNPNTFFNIVKVENKFNVGLNKKIYT